MPDNAKPAQDLGDFLADSGHTQAASHWLQECINRDKRNAHCLLKLGLLHMQAGRHAASIPLLQRAATLQPSRSAFNGLGVAYFHTKQADLALLAYASAVATDDGIIANTVAVLVNAAGAVLPHDAALAVRAYTSAVRCKASHAQARFGLGRALLWLTPPKAKLAAHHLGQSIRLDPTLPQVARVFPCNAARSNLLTPFTIRLTFITLAL
jgi:tetratricopeptide (TPR) repeat protein